MTSIIETGNGNAGQDSQLATAVDLQQQRKRFDQNYGAMITVMGYLTPKEQLILQGLDKWQYDVGVSRVQVHFQKPKMFYLADQSPQILAVSETGESKWFDCRGESDFSNEGWKSCQVGQTQLFQSNGDSSRILKVDHSQRSFTVERQWEALPDQRFFRCLTNFKDEFIFLFASGSPIRRYSLAEDRLEETSIYHNFNPVSACSLGDIVYAFDAHHSGRNWIHIVLNPGASISETKVVRNPIKLPEDVCTERSRESVFMPLNTTEIAILGGLNRDGPTWFGDALIFNTSTCELKKEFEDGTDPFCCYGNQSAKVSENTIIALVRNKTDQKRLIKYKKGDTCVTRLNSDDFE